MSLKPQDIVVVLKLCGYASGDRPTYAVTAAELSMSPSEIHGAVKRLRLAGLLNGPEMGDRPNLSALEEFFFNTRRQIFFSAESGPLTRYADILCGRTIKPPNQSR